MQIEESRVSDRTSHHYTMVTPARQTPAALAFPLSGSHAQPHGITPSIRTGRASGPSTPVSPKMPYSVGQPYPPKLSPGRGSEMRSTSPGYFGLVVDDSVDPRDSSSLLPRQNWSTASSSVKPFAAAVPKQVPLEANADFEAFRRQTDANRGKGLGFPTPTFTLPPVSTISIKRPRVTRWHTQLSSSTTGSAEAPTTAVGATSTPHDGAAEANRMDVDRDSLHDSAYVSGDSKRNSEACIAPPPPLARMMSLDTPADTTAEMPGQKMTLSKFEDRDPRLSVMGNKIQQPPAVGSATSLRPQSAPLIKDAGPSMIMPGQLRQMMEDANVRVLLLDVRSAQSYNRSQVRNALNLCMPTTLLKRSNYNLAKLQTFQREEHRLPFSQWREADCLVVYDQCSSLKTEAMTAVNLIEKFIKEGYSGTTHILRGGYKLFEEECPDLIDYHDGGNTAPTKGGFNPLSLGPIIGGVTLPSASGNTPNPFFQNIRQNMDLADGVGQMDLRKPSGLETSTLPHWLRDVADEDNHGKKVAEKFLNIECDEQARMKEAFSLINCAAGSQQNRACVQLCGIEQGEKNRYKDILPFEHSRVKLQGDLHGRSDYINASHIKASRSNKRYLATQGPLPATFEDFWSVIWDQDVRVIVMLTAETEGGNLKCHSYWKTHEYGPLKLKKLSEQKISLDIDKQPTDSRSSEHAESGRRRANTTTAFGAPAAHPTQSPRPQGEEAPHVIIRKFLLHHGGHPFEQVREITHLHYPSWPDFGVPARASDLLALVELANSMQKSPVSAEAPSGHLRRGGLSTWTDEPELNHRARPMLVHCSAGCGRTGAFCTVDSVIDMLKRQRLNKTTRHRGGGSGGVGGQVAHSGEDPDIDVTMEEAVASPQGRSGNDYYTRRHSGHSTSTRSSPETSTLDLSWLDNDNLDLVQMTVEDFRKQRLSMVQSLRQYVLCYEAILEWVWRAQDRGGHGDGLSRGRVRARSGSLQFPRE